MPAPHPNPDPQLENFQRLLSQLRAIQHFNNPAFQQIMAESKKIIPTTKPIAPIQIAAALLTKEPNTLLALVKTKNEEINIFDRDRFNLSAAQIEIKKPVRNERLEALDLASSHDFYHRLHHGILRDLKQEDSSSLLNRMQQDAFLPYKKLSSRQEMHYLDPGETIKKYELAVFSLFRRQDKETAFCRQTVGNLKHHL